jgi:hypothetical protein
MLDNKEIIKVTNRDNGSVGYSIPDLGNLHRDFMAGETKEITMEELRKLSYVSGGKSILKNYLIIHNDEAIKELINGVEPEYFYTEEDIKNLLLNGSLDALKDCIDFGPTGTVDLIKKLAVDLKINDIAKRKAIKEMTGFNVDSAISINEETSEDDIEQKPTVRRLAGTEPKAVTTKERRTSISVPQDKYKVIK